MHGSHNMNHVERGSRKMRGWVQPGAMKTAVNKFFKKIRAKKRRNFKSDETPSF